MTASDAEHLLMVCWALNDPENEDHVRELVEAIESQRDIPGVLTIESGPRNKQVDWEGPDTKFDYSMVLTFNNFDSVRAYPPHPIHQMLVATILRVGSNIRGFWIDRSLSAGPRSGSTSTPAGSRRRSGATTATARISSSSRCQDS